MTNEKGGREQKPKIAFIRHLNADSKGRGAYCSNCKGDLTYFCFEEVSKITCQLLSSRFGQSEETISPESRNERISLLKNKLVDLYVCPSCKYSLKEVLEYGGHFLYYP